MRILAYDRNLGTRAPGDSLRFVVLGGAESSCTELGDELTQLASRLTLSGRKATVEHRVIKDGKTIAAALGRSKTAAAYICSDIHDSIPEITRVARANSVLTIGVEHSAVKRGVSVAIASEEGRIQLYVNIAAMKAENVSLDAAVLGLAKVVR